MYKAGEFKNNGKLILTTWPTVKTNYRSFIGIACLSLCFFAPLVLLLNKNN